MVTIRAKLADVTVEVRTAFRAEAAVGAGGNSLLSKAERRALPEGILKEEALALTGRVTIDRAADAATLRVTQLLGSVNQPSGPGQATISKAEVKALAKLEPEAGRRVATAWEVLTGKPLKLPETGAPSGPADPPPSPGSVSHAISAASSSAGFQFAVEDGALTISGHPTTPGSIPAGHTVELDLSGEHVSAALPPTFGPPKPRTIVEALRAAMPDRDLLVLAGSSVSSMRIRVYAKGEAPHPAEFPVYAHFVSPPMNPSTNYNFVRNISGTKSFELMASMWSASEPVRLVVDDRQYEVSAGSGVGDGIQAIKALKKKLEDDGISLDFKNYGNVVKFKLL